MDLQPQVLGYTVVACQGLSRLVAVSYACRPACIRKDRSDPTIVAKLNPCPSLWIELCRLFAVFNLQATTAVARPA